MTKDNVIRLAKEAGANVYNGGPHFSWKELKDFAKLVAEHERERIKQANKPELEKCNAYIKELEKAVIDERAACAKVCEELAELSRISDTDSMWEWGECAAAIRARGKS